MTIDIEAVLKETCWRAAASFGEDYAAWQNALTTITHLAIELDQARAGAEIWKDRAEQAERERDEARAEVERKDAAIKRQAAAVRTLHHNEQTEVNQLRAKARDEYRATATLDSEREMNAILTDENLRLTAQLAAAQAEVARWKSARDECERQFQEQVAECAKVNAEYDEARIQLAARDAAIEDLKNALIRAESDFHLIALDSSIRYELQRNVVQAREKCTEALISLRQFQQPEPEADPHELVAREIGIHPSTLAAATVKHGLELTPMHQQPEPDKLVEALQEITKNGVPCTDAEWAKDADAFRAALAARGGRVVFDGEVG